MSEMERIYLMAGRKAWLHDVPKSWKAIAWERFDYIECAIFEKPSDELTEEDKKGCIAEYSEKPKGWIEPLDYNDAIGWDNDTTS